MRQVLTWERLLASYDGVLLDAYGVLVHGAAVIPGADAFVARLRREGPPWCVVTNDASRPPAAIAAKLRSRGLSVDDAQVFSSGSLLPQWLESAHLAEHAVAVLGPRLMWDWLSSQGIQVVPLNDPRWSVLAICDESGFDFLSGMDAALTGLCLRLDRGEDVHIVTPNPDLVYSVDADSLGFAAGTMAAMLERALHLRYGASAPPVHFLGKPHPPIYERAIAALGAERPLMVGDQLATDVRGAQAMGIDSLWVRTGVLRDPRSTVEPLPTWTLASVSELTL